jgi:aminopeptidase N
MLGALTHWQRHDPQRQALMREQLQRIIGLETLSRDVYEVASKSLQANPT